MGQKDARVIYENCVFGQSKRMSQRVLINVAAETNCN